jgi:chorismate mutase-like protein
VSTHPPRDEQLEGFRAEIDALDDQIVELLARRFAVVDRVAEHKASNAIPMMSMERVIAVKERNAERAQRLGIDVDLVRAVYEEIVDRTCDYEEARIERLRSV